MLVECEGAEPELFFRANKDAVFKFCNALELHMPKQQKTKTLLSDLFPGPTVPTELAHENRKLELR